MTSEQQENELTENFTKKPSALKLYTLQRKLHEAEALDVIFEFTNGQNGDIVEVFWEEGGPVHVNASPSLKYPILPPPSESGNISKLFKSITTIPSPVNFDSDRSMLYLSPLMSPLHIEGFIDQISEEERGLIQRLAIDQDKFEDLENNLLLKFNALKELIIVSEIATGEHHTLGPLADPPQKVVLYLAESDELRSEQPWDPNDLRLHLESELGEIRDSTTGAWPGKPVKVNVSFIKRDGWVMDTDFVSKLHKDLITKEKDKKKADAKRAAEAKEREEASEIAATPEIDENEGDTVGRLSLESLSLQHHDALSSRASTTEPIVATAAMMAAMDELDRRVAERKKMAELHKQDEEIEDALANYEEGADGFQDEIDDEDAGAEHDDHGSDDFDADAIED